MAGVARVTEFLKNPKTRKIYSDWISRPDTQVILSLVRDLCVPVRLAEPNPDSSLYYYGIQVGFHELLDVLSDLPASIVDTQGRTMDLGEPDYGARGILEQEAVSAPNSVAKKKSGAVSKGGQS